MARRRIARPAAPTLAEHTLAGADFQDPEGAECAVGATWIIQPEPNDAHSVQLRLQADQATWCGGDVVDALIALRAEAGPGVRVSVDQPWARRWATLNACLSPIKVGRAANAAEGLILVEAVQRFLAGDFAGALGGPGPGPDSSLAAILDWCGWTPQYNFFYPDPQGGRRVLVWQRPAGVGAMQMAISSDGYVSCEYVASSGGNHLLGAFNLAEGAAVPLAAAVVALAHLADRRSRQLARRIRFPLTA